MEDKNEVATIPQMQMVSMDSRMQKLEYESKQMDYDLKLAQTLSRSDLVPAHFKGKQNDIFGAIQYGRSLGLEVMPALRTIKVIKGTPGLDAQGMIAVIMGSGKADGPVDIQHEKDNNGKIIACTSTWTRQGKTFSKRFSMQDAKNAGIAGNSGWQNYPENMLEWRSIAFASRLAFPDVLNGIYTKDEIEDMQEVQQLKKIIPSKANELLKIENDFAPGLQEISTSEEILEMLTVEAESEQGNLDGLMKVWKVADKTAELLPEHKDQFKTLLSALKPKPVPQVDVNTLNDELKAKKEEPTGPSREALLSLIAFDDQGEPEYEIMSGLVDAYLIKEDIADAEAFFKRREKDFKDFACVDAGKSLINELKKS